MFVYITVESTLINATDAQWSQGIRSLATGLTKIVAN